MTGPRILVVEDEFLVACMLEDDLRDRGYDIVGPYNGLASALDAVRTKEFDAAVLDVNLGGTPVFPLADDLVRRAIPFVFLSGYGVMAMPERLRSIPLLAKPCDPATLDRELRGVLLTRR